jgi:hypothetical protein
MKKIGTKGKSNVNTVLGAWQHVQLPNGRIYNKSTLKEAVEDYIREERVYAKIAERKRKINDFLEDDQQETDTSNDAGIKADQ